MTQAQGYDILKSWILLKLETTFVSASADHRADMDDSRQSARLACRPKLTHYGLNSFRPGVRGVAVSLDANTHKSPGRMVLSFLRVQVAGMAAVYFSTARDGRVGGAQAV